MDWRDQPPYKPADPDKEFDTTYTGACTPRPAHYSLQQRQSLQLKRSAAGHCKKVKFLVHGEPLKVKYCHCKGEARRCQAACLSPSSVLKHPACMCRLSTNAWCPIPGMQHADTCAHFVLSASGC